MAQFLRADAQIFNPFSDYIAEQATLRSSFITSGLVSMNPVIEANITKGDTCTLPSWAPNLDGAIQVPTEGVMLTVNKLLTAQQTGVIHHRANAWGASDLAALAVGAANDPMAAIGAKIASYVANAQQAVLLATLKGLFGVPGTLNSSYALTGMTIDGGTSQTDLSLTHVVRGDLLLGEDEDAYGILIIHPDTNAVLKVQSAYRYVRADELPGITASTIAAGSITASNAIAADNSGAFETGSKQVPVFAGKRVIVSDSAPRVGSPGSYKYMSFMCRPGGMAFGYQAPIRTETDRDILTSSGEDVVKVQWDACFHMLGTSYSGATGAGEPTNATLETAASWTKVFDNKNIGAVAINHTLPAL